MKKINSEKQKFASPEEDLKVEAEVEHEERKEIKRIQIKIFLTWFLGFIMVFIFITLAVAYGADDGERAMGFVNGYIIVSILFLLGSALKMAETSVNRYGVKFKTIEFLEREKMSIQRFRERYKDIMYIYEDLYEHNDNDYRIYDGMNNINNRNSISDVLTDKQIINFLQYIKPKDIDTEDKTYEMLDRNVPLKEIFKKDEDGYGYFFRALYVEGEEKYIISFGESGPGGGSGSLYTIYIDEEDNIEMEEDALIEGCHWDN